MTKPLRLSLLPSLRVTDDSKSLLMEKEGFVDEAVVTAMMSGSPYSRGAAYPEDLALAADDLDFAGWQLSSTLPPRGPEVPPQVIDAIIRRALPPVVAEPGLGVPHQGRHRWWLAGLAGALSTMLFSLLLLSLSARPGSHFNSVTPPRVLTRAQPKPEPKAATTEMVPELTDASLFRR